MIGSMGKVYSTWAFQGWIGSILVSLIVPNDYSQIVESHFLRNCNHPFEICEKIIPIALFLC